MKKIFHKFRLWQFKFFIWAMNRDFGPQLDIYLKKRSMSLASDVSQRLYMDALTREGFIHCHKCPQRFGLRRLTDGQYGCKNHSQEAVAA